VGSGQGAEELSIAALLEKMVHDTKYAETLMAEGTEEAESRVENIRELLTAAQESHERNESLREFLDHATLVSDQDQYKRDAPVTLMTAHSAKGLEFHSVFIIWALEGRFPSFYNTNSSEELEEERRLLYVAATRAKQNLFISYPTRVFDKSLRMVLSQPSQFIDGLSSRMLEPVALVPRDLTGIGRVRRWCNYCSTLSFSSVAQC